MSIELADDTATARAGQALAALLRPGDTVLLQGPVGAGKSALARALIQHRMAASGLVEDVPSPTFTLVQTYDLPGGVIWHADLYRLSDPDEIIELGLEDAFEDQICLVEWPDRLGRLRPDAALTLTLTPTESDTRRLSLEWSVARWEGIEKALAQAIGSS